jgi:hypothetical protein
MTNLNVAAGHRARHDELNVNARPKAGHDELRGC